MKRTGTGIAILSVTAPGPEVISGRDAQRQLAREINEYAAKLRDDQPQTFGFFASLPSLLDTEGCLEEIRYALDEIHADGVTLFTRYGDGHQYLGDEAFKPVMEELHRRKVVAFIHPTHSVDTTLVHPTLPQPILDYPHESCKTAMSLILSGRKEQCKDVNFVLSHAGGTLPSLLQRAAHLIPGLPSSVYPDPPSGEYIVEQARTFYYDLALSTTPGVLKALLDMVPVEQVLFGSDFPYADEESIFAFAEELEKADIDDEQRNKTYRANASKLILRYSS